MNLVNQVSCRFGLTQVVDGSVTVVLAAAIPFPVTMVLALTVPAPARHGEATA